MGIAISESDSGTKMKVKDTIEKTEQDIVEECKQELEAIWQKIVDAAIEYCPKDTGALASTIKAVDSSEGGGAISESPRSTNDFLNKTLIAGDDTVINRKTGKPTSAYAGLVHDGHVMRDGTFWEGVPFLAWAMMQYELELEDAVARAVQKSQEGEDTSPHESGGK
jgi:hypothetical protein